MIITEKLEILERLEAKAKKDMNHHIVEMKEKIEAQNRALESHGVIVGEISNDVRSIMTTV
jgi:hypothetical protein